MRYRRLSPFGDYTFGGSLANFYINTPQAPGQAVQTRLLLWQGEWYLDTSLGTPYFTGILGKHSQSMADTTTQDRVLGTQGVTDISNFQSELNTETRAYSVNLAVNTQYGPTQVQIQNYVNY